MRLDKELSLAEFQEHLEENLTDSDIVDIFKMTEMSDEDIENFKNNNQLFPFSCKY